MGPRPPYRATGHANLYGLPSPLVGTEYNYRNLKNNLI